MADSAYGRPLIIRGDEAPIAMERISVSTSTADGGLIEADIQKLAFEHPQCLPIAEIDRAYEHLVPICTELNTPAGPLDALYVTPTGRLVILEAKLWRNPEARRKVVAQILDYAKEFSGWDYHDLQRQVRQRLDRKDEVIYQLVRERYPDTDEAQFIDEVQQSLTRGRFLLLIVGDGIREGAGAIADFLESVGSLEFTFGLVELALYRHADIGLLVQPRVIARTVEFRRTIVQLPSGASLVEPEPEDSGEQTLGERQQFYRDFWTELLSELQLDDGSQRMANITKSENIYFLLPPSGTQTWVSAYFAKSTETVGVYLRMAQGPFADKVFQRLESERETIISELGIPVEWEAAQDNHSIAVSRTDLSDVHSPQHRAEIKAFFADAVNRFVNVFRPRLERLVEEVSD